MTTPSSTTYQFDYVKIPTAITTATGPAFPSRFHDIIYLGMAVDDYAIQQFDKARSYANENQIKYIKQNPVERWDSWIKPVNGFAWQEPEAVLEDKKNGITGIRYRDLD
jgi:hypothetical protein